MNASQLNCLTKAKKIGMFDSGLGGLSVLSSLTSRKEFAHIDFVYIGDTNRCPYGNRPYGQIKQFVDELKDFLLSEGADAIVMACNTSAALVADELKVKCNVPVIDLLSPTASYIAKQNFKRVGVIATNSTANSKAFSQAIHLKTNTVEVFEQGCPTLVPIVESGLYDDKQAEIALEPYIRGLVDNNVEAIVFGCTHYPFLANALKRTIKNLTDKPIVAIDPASVLANDIAQLMKNKELGSELTRKNMVELVTTGDAESFKDLAAKLLKQERETLDVREEALAKPAKPVTKELSQKPVITSISPA